VADDAHPAITAMITTPAATQRVTADPESRPAQSQSASDDGQDGEEVKSAAQRSRKGLSRVRVAALVGLVTVASVAGLVGWLGFEANTSQHAQQRRNLFLEAGRQGALNLTTIDWQRADADVQRILDSATGKFYDDMSRRSQPFVDVVKQVQSKSVGTITDAGLESESADQAQVLVAVTVKTSTAAAPEQVPRAWRMQISVQTVGDQAKVSDVAFVP
jgi:Mce-associated membrane protein